MTVVQLWCEHKGQQGGTVRQALQEFKELSAQEQRLFYNLLVDSLLCIPDYDLHHVQDFLRAVRTP